MSENREKFATQMDKDILARLRKHAKSEGRQIQSIVEEAVEAFIDERQGYKMHPDIKAAYDKSIKKFGPLYEKLAQ